MNIFKISNIDDLKSLGKFSEVKSNLKKIVCPLELKARSWEEIFKVVKLLQEKWIDAIPGPFVSRQAEIIFYLTKLDGKKRNEFLGLAEEHYKDINLAKKWHRSLRKFVHSDRKGGNDAAFIALEKLYKIVTYQGDGDE